MRTPRRAGHFPPLPTAPTPPCTPVAGNKARGRATVTPRPGSGTRGLRHRSRAPRRAFSVSRELSGCRPLPPADEPLGPASGPPRGGRGSPQPAPPAPRQPRGAGPHCTRLAAAPRADPARRSPARRRRLQQLRTPAPRPGGPGASPSPTSRPPLPSRDSQAPPRTGPVLGEGM